MKNVVKSGGYLILALIVTGLAIIIYFHGVPWRKADLESPEIIISAESLIEGLSEGHPSLSMPKAEQRIEISGFVQEINTRNNGLTLLLKGPVEKAPYIICAMRDDQKTRLDKLKKNDSVAVTGVFKGFLKDAVVLDCIVTYGQFDD